MPAKNLEFSFLRMRKTTVSNFQFRFERRMKPVSLKYLSIASALFFLIMFLSSTKGFCQKKYIVHYTFSTKDTSNIFHASDLKTDFDSKETAQKYIVQLPQMLFNKGFAAASVDSVLLDSTYAHVKIYLGKRYQWAEISTDSIDENVLSNTGWNKNSFENKELHFQQLRAAQQKIMEYYQNTGYPFAEVGLQNIEIKNDKLKAELYAKKGPLYHIDSIRVFGKVKIKNTFLQHYLGISKGSIYNNQKLQDVDKLIQQLPFVQEQQSSDVTMLGSGATLNLYLAQKPNSEVNVLIGFEPANTITGKAQITADVHLNLKNSFGNGENILLNWQQLQPQSPRLNLAYSVPYIFNSNFGMDFSFDLLKKDSSYLQLNEILGLQYVLSPNKTFKIFYEKQQNFLLQAGVDTSQVIYTKQLPSNIDVSSSNVGVGYHFINTNYYFNPRKGNEADISATAGIKKVSKNNDIVNLKDPSDPAFDFNKLYDSIKSKSYRVQIVASAAHYFPVAKASTIKAAVHAAILESPQNFKNELFRIGGYRLLRGFDEESIYANKYAVFSVEYRYLVGTNSYFFGFSDAGFTQTKFNKTDYSNSFLSAGAGLQFETKFGLLNLSYALGKRNDVKFDLRHASRIHFGYINYF